VLVAPGGSGRPSFGAGKVLAATIIRASRPPFLLLALVVVLLGHAVAILGGATPALLDSAMVLLGGVAAHACVNLLNEYHDARSGLDDHTLRTPFSGGSGALQERPDALKAVWWSALAALAITVAVGVYFIWLRGWAMLPLGIGGLLLVLSYTPWLNRSAFLCLIAPGLGFGPVMVLGSELALSGQISRVGVWASLLPFYLVSNLLLLNQYPDLDADRMAGRRHFPIRHGLRISSRIYLGFVLAAMAVIVTGVLSGMFPPLALLALLPTGAALYAWVGAIRYGEMIAEAPRFLVANVLAALLTPLLLAAAMLAGA
jgi:1,4-dihydroxy-2-naphthoate octaprenyltransferase